MPARLLCLSNGHGEDAIAVRVLAQLQARSPQLEVAALPLVGGGSAYERARVPLVGPVQPLPSGGFIYMDGRQLWRDLRGGLAQLTWAQWRAVRRWRKGGGRVLAVGDIVPLLMAWLSGLPFAFVGTAKSDYYWRDEAGWLPQTSRWERWMGSVYLPWERWLMQGRTCRAVFPRDSLTARRLQHYKIDALDLGNPMVDAIAPEFAIVSDSEDRALRVLLLPGSRSPEAEANWRQLLDCAMAVAAKRTQQHLCFLAAIAPALDRSPFREDVLAAGWGAVEDLDAQTDLPFCDPQGELYRRGNALLVLTQQAYGSCLTAADVAIAMAGTATEQFVGLGKPAIALPGRGPQFTYAFAEAQTRLLGCSMILADSPESVARRLQDLLQDPDRLQLAAENGQRRLGVPGADDRIAAALLDCLL
ncbi:hypothetical protein KR51_00001540 [Rubidibacter lacunae KORDI 51-2]|uniref:Lipid-A-disaccharide synthase n=1 Tax=Rubidibacter lacunae KORDI 51-2 TaxID=582515 RepID=U5DQK1_9CHRO|nr:lipid-A-disaccharide synthase-related protein [Rubidibacter lacunae]ERN43092.1 hypothetical protein KR51_00001540 [Rubidibacter lacunae KORDI 51-2]